MDTSEYRVESGEIEGQDKLAEEVSPPPGQPNSAEETPEEGPAEVEESQSPTLSQEETQEEMERSSKPLTTGQIVEGLIVHIDDDGALVDVGTKSEGHVAKEELAGGTTEDGKPLQVGDKISVYVVRPEDSDGHPVLSKKRADYDRVWRRVIEAHEDGSVLSAMVTDRVKGGLVVDLGLRGFLPASHVRTRNIHALDRFVGQSLKVKIIEVDRARKRVVVSHKNAVEEERARRRERTLANMEESKVYRGVVRRITNYGAFVDLGGVDGLLHITEMAWTRIDHPSQVVKVGDKIDVMVLRFDQEQNRISLGLKQILPDPWEEVPSKFKVNQIVKGTITRVVPFGAFIRVETGIEGIIPNSELSSDRSKKASDLLSAGDTVDVKIINIRPTERRMTLSLRQVEQAKERQQIKEYMRRQEDESRVTIGDLFGNVLAGTQAAQQGAQNGDEAASAQSEETSPESSGAEVAEEDAEYTEGNDETAVAETSAVSGEEQQQGEEAEPESEAAAAETTEDAGEEEQASPVSSEDALPSSESPAESEAEKD
ncbi:MAG: 30S ribosomal protein S1 [Armatimonadetes bacterium]|nr:30S ribosomal protein S1 [Armatimonadota bacterium]